MVGYTAEGQVQLEHENEEYIADVAVDVSFEQEERGLETLREISRIIQIVKNDINGTIVHNPSESLKDAVYASANRVIFFDEY